MGGGGLRGLESLNFFHKESKSKKKIFFFFGGGSGVWCGEGGGMGGGKDGWTDEQAQTNLPLHLL